MLPDKEVTVTVSADGFEGASRKLTLPEGKTEEVTFVLEPKAPKGAEPMRRVVAAAVGLLAMLGGPAVVGRRSSSRCGCRTDRRCRLSSSTGTSPACSGDSAATPGAATGHSRGEAG